MCHKNPLFSYPISTDWSSYWKRTLFSLTYGFLKYIEHQFLVFNMLSALCRVSFTRFNLRTVSRTKILKRKLPSTQSLFCFFPLSDKDFSCIRLRPLPRILFVILRIFPTGSRSVLIFIKLSYGINVCYFCTNTASVQILMCSDIQGYSKLLRGFNNLSYTVHLR